MNNKYLRALKAAFPNTVPILAGFLFLGITYGVLMRAAGFNYLYSTFISITTFAGAMQYLAIAILQGAFNPLSVFLMTLLVNARHIFYGISMLDNYKSAGKKGIYMIFAMCDESFSVNYSATIPSGVDKGWFMFFVALLIHIYWVVGSALGGIFGSFITFNTKGMDFVLTAMFIVIFINNWQKEKNHISSVIGVFATLFWLLVVGSEYFLIPSLASIIIILLVMQKRIESEVDNND